MADGGWEEKTKHKTPKELEKEEEKKDLFFYIVTPGAAAACCCCNYGWMAK